MVQMANKNGVRWYRHVLRRDDGHVLRKALEKEDALNHARWRVSIGEIAVRVE